MAAGRAAVYRTAQSAWCCRNEEVGFGVAGRAFELGQSDLVSGVLGQLHLVCKKNGAEKCVSGVGAACTPD